MMKEAQTGKEFVRFVNTMINDTTFLLDESLEPLEVEFQSSISLMLNLRLFTLIWLN